MGFNSPFKGLISIKEVRGHLHTWSTLPPGKERDKQ